MKIPNFITPATALAVVLINTCGINIASAAEVLLIEEDFEKEAIEDLVVAQNNVAILDLADDPEEDGDHGTVAVIEMSGGGEWGSLNPTPDQRIELAPQGVAAGADTYELTADFYIPSETVLFQPDSVGVIVRAVAATGGEKDENGNNPQVGNNPVDEWFTLSVSGPIPGAISGGTIPVTHLQPIISIRDTGPDADAGVAVYIDNIRLTGFTSGEDPNLVATTTSPFGSYRDLDPKNGVINISNSGLANKLTISEANITGADAEHFEVTTTIPIELEPGSPGEIAITFTPGKGVSAYNAELVLVSDDTSDPMITVPLSALVLDAVAGGDLIINGGFETGSTVGFTANANSAFKVITEPVHSGEYAAVYEMAGGLQWGSVNLDQPSPPAPEDGPSNWIEITEDMWEREWFFSSFYSIPEENAIAENDTAQFIIRWNGVQPDAGPFQSVSGAGLFPGEWTEYTETGIVPTEWPVDSGNPVTSAFLIFSFRDVDSDAAGGEQIYVDDWSFTIDVPDPEPEPEDLIFTGATYDAESREVTISWNSQPGETFTITSSPDLQDWSEIEDGVSASDDGTSTSFTDANLADDTVRYYQVKREDQE